MILKENKNRIEIYKWIHLESGKIYIGSAINLFIRLKYYYSIAALKQNNNIISRALVFHTHSAFFFNNS
jgi:hypothetical protein